MSGPKIVNIVVSADIHTNVDLNHITRELKNTEFEPEQFPGLVYKLDSPDTSTLIFSTGKLICTGARTIKDAEIAIKKIVEDLKSIGYEMKKKPELRLQNIVATDDLNITIDLEALIFELSNCEYEPEQFPGLVYRVQNPKVAILVFNTGKIVCAGAKSEEDVKKGIKQLVAELKDLGMMD
ncbi:MAG: TATA-box-binding protein [Euryarchaeota archaeon]|nr:TATA-box-binding protein [Euryarchaeota archaeon]